MDPIFRSIPVLDRLLERALCRGETPDADRATIALYMRLLRELAPRAADVDAPCVVAVLMFGMARRLMPGPASPPPATAVASSRRGPEPLSLAA
jgi:hypothetical protein